MNRLILLAIWSWMLPSCAVEQQATAGYTSNLARHSYRLKSWWSVLRQKHAYEVRGRNWFTSSLSGAFAENRSGQVHGKTHSTFGEFSAYSDLGSGLKYTVNQDGYALFHAPDRAVLTVFDGISTGGSGERATEVAITTLRNELPQSSLAAALLDVRKGLSEYLQANSRISTKYGVCAAGVEIRGNTATVSHVGDVRLLHVRDGEVLFQTRDHNLTWDKVVHGEMTPEQYVQDSVSKNIIKKALQIPMQGDFGTATIDTSTHHLSRGDMLVIASDAVWNLFTSEAITQLIQGRSTQEAVLAIREAVKLRVGNLKNRDDNFTLAIYHHDPKGLL